MRRILAVATSTLVLSTLVAPGAKAIRPELLPQRSHPTISEAVISRETVQNSPVKKTDELPQSSQPSQAIQKSTDSKKPSFEDFEKAYKDKYGT